MSVAAASELVLSEAEGLNIFREIRSSMPDLILAVGADALLGLKAIKDIPIVYAMVSNPESIPFAGANITGVSMNISPEKQLSLLREAFPDLHENRSPLQSAQIRTLRRKSSYFVQGHADKDRS